MPSHTTRLSRIPTLIPYILKLPIPHLTRLFPLKNIATSSRQPQLIRRDEILTLRRRPLARFPRLNIQQEHRVDFFQAATGSFRQEEEDDEHRKEVETREEVAVGEADVAFDEGGCEADEEVEDLDTWDLLA